MSFDLCNIENMVKNLHKLTTEEEKLFLKENTIKID